MTKCSRCESFPLPYPEEGTLYLAPRLGHTAAKLHAFLSQHGHTATEPFPGIIAVDVGLSILRELAEPLTGLIGELGMRTTRAVMTARGRAPSLMHLSEVESLSTLLSRSNGQWLIDLIQADRLTCHYQPIVHARDLQRVFAFESLLRGLNPNDSLISPGRLFAVARDADLVFQLDRAARLKAIHEASKRGGDVAQFINFNPLSIYEPEYCLQSTFNGVKELGMDPGRIIFEVVESERIDDLNHLTRILDTYRKAGFRVALDDVGAGHSSLSLLSRLRPDFIKLDMDLIRGIDRDPFKATITAKLLEAARDLGIQTVVEGVETRAELEWAQGHGADFMQGYLIAKPASPPPSPNQLGG